jgi:hypothetical protein
MMTAFCKYQVSLDNDRNQLVKVSLEQKASRQAFEKGGQPNCTMELIKPQIF